MSFSQFKEFDSIDSTDKSGPSNLPGINRTVSRRARIFDGETLKSEVADRGEINFPIRRTLTGHRDEVISVAIMSTAYVSLAKDGEIQVWFLGN